VLSSFEEAKIECPVIFTTAYDEYALKAFKFNSVDYLLKPVVKEELAYAVSKWRGWKNGRVLLVGEYRGIQEVDDGMSYHQYPLLRFIGSLAKYSIVKFAFLHKVIYLCVMFHH
jgi:YesN/AraC family two-component response regulator